MIYPRFTGLVDRHGHPIYEGDYLHVGMRREDPSGWTTEVVAWNKQSKEWGLLDMKTRTEFMQMQHDPELRELEGESVFTLASAHK